MFILLLFYLFLINGIHKVYNSFLIRLLLLTKIRTHMLSRFKHCRGRFYSTSISQIDVRIKHIVRAVCRRGGGLYQRRCHVQHAVVWQAQGGRRRLHRWTSETILWVVTNDDSAWRQTCWCCCHVFVVADICCDESVRGCCCCCCWCCFEKWYSFVIFA